jgi:hypothetical protein
MVSVVVGFLYILKDTFMYFLNIVMFKKIYFIAVFFHSKFYGRYYDVEYIEYAIDILVVSFL